MRGGRHQALSRLVDQSQPHLPQSSRNEHLARRNAPRRRIRQKLSLIGRRLFGISQRVLLREQESLAGESPRT